MRIAEQDIVFDGYIIPKDAMIRLCMWESHHTDKVFPDPFAFKPERFMNGDPDQDTFSPFGLGHHRCPLAQTTIEIATMFIRILAKQYSLTAIGNDKPFRGAYHWEPSPNFYVELTPKNTAQHAAFA